jgi:hypothetical protein
MLPGTRLPVQASGLPFWHACPGNDQASVVHFNRRELYYLREAFQKLEAGLYPEGEDAMLKAERVESIPEAAATASATNDAVAVDDLRVEFDRIFKGGVP